MQILSKTDDAPKRAYDASDYEIAGSVFVTGTIKLDRKADVRHSFEKLPIHFENVDPIEIVELASRTVWINALQRPYRLATDAERVKLAKDWEKNGFPVRTWLDRERKRGPVDPVKAVAKALPDMTEAQKNELRALLGE